MILRAFFVYVGVVQVHTSSAKESHIINVSARDGDAVLNKSVLKYHGIGVHDKHG
jgi:hypothetical protein